MSCAVCTRGTHLIVPLMLPRQIPSSGPIGRILEVKASISPTACRRVGGLHLVDRVGHEVLPRIADRIEVNQ